MRNEAPCSQDWPPLSCSELPRRIFRTLRVDDKIDPLLRYLVERFVPSANSHKGYPLCRAVLAQNLEYIDFLLSHGASPSANDGLAIEIAISKQRLDIVKRLVERSPSKASNKGKKVKYDDRVKVSTKLVEHAMKNGSRDIVDYFVHDKGERPAIGSADGRCHAAAQHHHEDGQGESNTPPVGDCSHEVIIIEC